MRVLDPNGAGVFWHIVISPHFDDAVLSLGGTIARLTTSGQRVLVATMCAGIPTHNFELGKYSKKFLGRSSPAAWIISRREEDRRALGLLDADWYWEGALDAIFRRPEYYGSSGDHLFGPPLAGDSFIARATLSAAMLDHFGRGAMIYAPLGVGGHVDHRIVHDAVGAAVSEHLIGWYEDFPYAAKPGAIKKRVAELASRHGRSLRAVEFDVRDTLDRRIEAIAAYESQIEGLFGSSRKMVRAVRNYAGRDPTERIWVFG